MLEGNHARECGQLKPIIGFTICMLLTAYVAFHSWIKPYNNWDEVGYVGSAISWSAKSSADAQMLTFAYLRQAIPDIAFRDNTSGLAYRSAVYNDPSVFALQLPIYKVKIFYVALTWLGWKLGFNPVRVTAVISVLVTAILGGIVATILVRRIGLWAVIVYPVVLILGGMYQSGRLSSPDATSALVVFSAIWLLRRPETSQSGLLLMCLAVTVRPDNILLLLSCVAVFTPATAIFDNSLEISIAQMLGYAALGVFLLFLVGRLANAYSWRVLIHHSFAQPIMSARDLKGFRWTDYTHALMNGGDMQPGGMQWLMVFAPQFPLVLLIAYLMTFLVSLRRDYLLLIVSILYLLTHFLLFPSREERFFYGVYTFVFVLTAITVYANLRNE
jgi:hypothetical protein